MGLANLKAIMKKLLAEGCDPKRSVALIQSGTTKKQRVLRGTVKSISSLASSAGFRAPVVIVVGEVVRQFAAIDWFGDDTNSPRMGDSDGIPKIFEYSM
jgi:uroporphyrin-III C-methyltransferase/precorrin-2 dehydrogenase/sirohydrochlorin ferrochelatase